MSAPALVALAAAVAVVGAFMVAYTLLADWWATRYGRNLMGTSFAVFALLVLIGAEVALGSDYTGRDGLHTASLAIVAIVFARRLALLLRVQRLYPED